MAKKGSARREPDPDLEDEEVELDEAPPKKKSSARVDDKGSKTTSTGKRKSSEGTPSPKDSASRKGLKDSGKRKSTSGTSGRRPAGGDDEEEMSGSARRRRAVPVKKKDSSVVIGVSILTMTFILVVGIVLINKGRTPTVNNNDEQAQFEQFKTMKADGLKAFGEFNRAEREGNAGVSKAKHSEAHTKLVKAMDILTKILDKHRDPATGFTHKDYEGYESEQSEIAEILVDLEKRGDVNSSAGHGGGPSHDNSAPDEEDGGSPDPIPSSGGANDAGGSRTRGG